MQLKINDRLDQCVTHLELLDDETITLVRGLTLEYGKDWADRPNPKTWAFDGRIVDVEIENLDTDYFYQCRMEVQKFDTKPAPDGQMTEYITLCSCKSIRETFVNKLKQLTTTKPTLRQRFWNIGLGL